MGVGVGAVCRSDEGEIEGCMVVQLRVGWEPRIAEVRTVLEGAGLAKV